MGISFGLCFVADLAIMLTIALLGTRPFSGAGDRLPVYFVLIIPLVANGIAIWWAAATKRRRCMKGLIISTALVVLLYSACYGLST